MFETKLGKLYNDNCINILPILKDIDLITTSPPYDSLRLYHGYHFPFKDIAKLLYDCLAPGGVMVWVIGDGVEDGSETGTSFRHALYFKEIGFTLYDTMIWRKDSNVMGSINRYEQIFEYMFVLSKGKPKTINLLKEKKLQFRVKYDFSERDPNTGEIINKKGKTPKDLVYKKLSNIWHISTGYQKTTKDKVAFEHPAIFPDELANKHILSWSNEGDIVLDPMCGSGTVLKAAEKLNRKWVGIEVSKEYYSIAVKRIKLESDRLKLF